MTIVRGDFSSVRQPGTTASVVSSGTLFWDLVRRHWGRIGRGDVSGDTGTGGAAGLRTGPGAGGGCRAAGAPGGLTGRAGVRLWVRGDGAGPEPARLGEPRDVRRALGRPPGADR